MTKNAKTTSTPSKASAPAKSAAKSKAVASAPKVAAAPTPAAGDDAAASDEVNPVSTVLDSFSVFMTKLQAVTSQISSLKTEFRTLERQVGKEMRAAVKASMKHKRKTGNRAPSGFVKPTLISNELADFLGKPKGTEMARTEVTREINSYIRNHKLQDKDNGRKIIPDTKLNKLLKIKKGEELTYFNLQKYMSPHFAKAGDKASATA
jgi:chromatin remodeling complex protein RSC6